MWTRTQTITHKFIMITHIGHISVIWEEGEARKNYTIILSASTDEELEVEKQRIMNGDDYLSAYSIRVNVERIIDISKTNFEDVVVAVLNTDLDEFHTCVTQWGDLDFMQLANTRKSLYSLEDYQELVNSSMESNNFIRFIRLSRI